MIRKILFLALVVFTILWFAVAYTVKNDVARLIAQSESDNVKIAYDELKISGYPARWKIDILNPKIKFIDHENSKELASKHIKVSFGLSLKTARIDFGQEIIDTENYDNRAAEYIIKSDDSIKLCAKFNKPLYKTSNHDTIKSIMKSVQLDNRLATVINDNKTMFNLQDLAFFIKKSVLSAEENIDLKLALRYSSQEKLLNFQNANLNLDTSVNFVVSDGSHAVKDLFINNLVFACDDSTQVDMNGKLQFFADKLPTGKLSFDVINYHHVIDKLVPNNVLISKTMIKSIIAQSSAPDVVATAPLPDAVSDEIKKVSFNIEFSETGIKIGAVNLLELKLGEEKLGSAAETSN